MKTKITRIIIALGSLLLAGLAWLSLNQEKNTEIQESMNALLFFSAFFILISLLLTIAKDKKWPLIILALSLLISLFFTFQFFHLAIIILAIGIAWGGMFLIRKDFDLSVKLSLIKSFKIGRTLLVFSIALVISSQFFLKLEKEDKPDLAKGIQIQSILGNNFYKDILAIFSPEVKDFKPEMTIDEALLQNYQSQMDFLGSSLPSYQKNILKEFEKEQFLQADRRKLSELVGRDIRGDESIDGVMSQIVNNRINQIFSFSSLGENREIVSSFLALLTFLTIWSLGSVLAVFLVIVSAWLFWFLRKAKLVEIELISVEKERIA